MNISLITTLYNESNNVLKFLESYNNQIKYADEFIIVDGGSTDGTIEMIQDFIDKNQNLNIKLIVDKTCSKKYTAGPIAKGRNVAIKNAKYDYIAVTDAGCVLDKHWFEEIIKPFENNNVDVVSGWYEANITNEFQKIYAEIYIQKLENLQINNFLPSSRSIAFKKECWEKVGRYLEQTLTAEDTLFDLNLKKVKCKFCFTQKAIVYWDCPRDYEEACQKAKYYALGDGQNRLYFNKFLIRNLFLIFPINILLSKLRRKFFKLSYGVSWSYQIGYLKGLLK